MQGHGNHPTPRPAKKLYWVPDVTDENAPPSSPDNRGNAGLHPVYGGHVGTLAGAGGLDSLMNPYQIPAGLYDNVTPWTWNGTQWVRA